MNKSIETFKEHFTNYIIENPKKSLSWAFCLFVVAITSVLSIQTNYTPRIWFHKDSEQIQTLKSFEKRFGGDRNIVVGIYAKKGVIDQGSIKILKELTDKMWQVPEVIRVESITNFNNISTVDDDINISPLVDGDVDLKDLEFKIKGLDEVKDVFVSKNLDFAMVYGRLRPFFGDNPNYVHVMQELEKNIAHLYKNPDIKPIVLGSVPITYAFRKISNSDNIKTIPLMTFLIIILLAIYFRSFAGVTLPLFISFITIGTSFGVLGHLGLIFNSILAAIPGILLAICLADTIHILSSFYQSYEINKNIKDSLRFAMEKNFLATILTTITTAVSFFTISFTELIPIRDLGMISALGTICAWFFTYLILGPMILLLPKSFVIPRVNLIKKKPVSSSGFAVFINRFKIPIIILFTILSSSAFWISLDNEVNSDPLKYFSNSTKIKEDYDFTKNYIEAIRGADIVIDSGSADGVKDPIFLNKVDTFAKQLEKLDEIVKFNSILDVIKKMNLNLNQNDPSYSRVPDTKGQVAEALFLYSLGLPSGMGIENQVSVDNRYLRAVIKWKVETTKEAVIMEKKIHQMAKNLGLSTHSGGDLPIYIQVNEKVVDSFFNSMLMAVFLVSLIILITFKDPLLSFLAMLPNIIPLFFGAAYMALNNIYIDIGTSIVSAICLGIAVDDTIHFITHYVQNSGPNSENKMALQETFKYTGKALIMTTMALVCGFGSFLVADFLPNHYFGILCAIVLSFALLTDLLLLPSILLIWSERKNIKINK